MILRKLPPPEPVFQLRETRPGRYRLEGELCFATAEQALQQVAGLLAEGGEATLDLAGVTRSDSAGVALLLEWRRLAERGGMVLHYLNLPQQLRAIAHVAGVEDLLGVAGS